MRGIYATALTNLLLKSGQFRIVEPSEEIRERFQLPDSPGPPDIEVRDLEDGQGVVASGEERAVDAFSALLRKELFDLIARPSSKVGGRGSTTSCKAVAFEFPGASKARLDELRGEVVPTIRGHHQRKAGGSGTVVELAEMLMRRRLDPGVLPKVGQELWIEHVKLDGSVIPLGKGKVIRTDPKAREIALRREIKAGGTYDGLDIEKEAGDYAITTFREGAWSYRTSYYTRDRRLKGEYWNINTPMEIYPEKIRYVDLEIDVVKLPDGAVRIIDEEKLWQAVEKGLITEKLAQRARRIAEELRDP
ncbi:MAG: DUF402 domain-containing protein [Candidatus Methylomirabilales bacterium]